MQFRQDVKNKRPNSPTYYHWKVQFVVIGTPEDLEQVKNILKCGNIHKIKNQPRYSVQNIDELKNTIVPYFEKREMPETKKRDFELWAKAVEIIFENKGKITSSWKKSDFQQLIDIQKSIKKFKTKPKQAKWLSTAEMLVKGL